MTNCKSSKPEKKTAVRSQLSYKILKVLQNPWIFYYLLRFNLASKSLASRNMVSKDELEQFRKEIEKSKILDEFNEKSKIFRDKVKGTNYRGLEYNMGTIGTDSGLKLYGLVRKLRPKVIVETGVCNGLSSALILLALHNNKEGKLYSIDYPEVEGTVYETDSFYKEKGGSVIPTGKQSGWLIPDYLRGNWTLSLGKSQEKLPELLEKLDSIDIFIHDSEHSYECMWFEFSQAYEKLRKGGCLVSDDILWNSSFFDFAKRMNSSITKVSGTMGLLVKN